MTGNQDINYLKIFKNNGTRTIKSIKAKLLDFVENNVIHTNMIYEKTIYHGAIGIAPWGGGGYFFQPLPTGY